MSNVGVVNRIMVSVNDPIESIFNSFQVVKDAFSPLESGMKKAAKDLESCWGQPDFISQLIGGDKNCEARICGVWKKSSNGANSINNVQCVSSDEEKKGFSIKVPIEAVMGMFSPNIENDNKVEVVKKGLKERDVDTEEGSCIKCLQFAVTWSLLVNGFVQAFASPLKSRKKRVQKVGYEDKRG